MAAEKVSVEESQAKGSQTSRENLVDVAVKFLNNPRVLNSPLDQKKAFLKKKGLSEDEITEAVRLSQLTPSLDPPPPTSPPLPLPSPFSQSSPFTTHTPSHLHPRSWRDYALIVAIVGSVGYAVYQFFKSYAIPWLNARLEQSDHMNEINTTVRQLQTNLDTTVSSISEATGAIRGALAEQQESIHTIAVQVTALQACMPKSGLSVKELKEEMATLKGLLLNRHQFSTPVPSSTVGIPSWQRGNAPSYSVTEKDDNIETEPLMNGQQEEEEGEGGGGQSKVEGD